MNIKILIASHREYQMPQDPIYQPIRVGNVLASDNFGYIGDDSGDNISTKNPFFCELTAIYWAWKNLNADFIGLAHYRRHFSWKRKDKDKFSRILSQEEAIKLCNEYDIILPKKRKYYIESLASHYKHTHDIKHVELTREIIIEKTPDYTQTFDKVMSKTSGHMFNMFIMRKNRFDDYCSWLFPILFELETKVDISGLSSFDARLFGRISEFLLNVWVEKNKIEYKEIGFVQLGKENWSLKIIGFLKAKFFGKKYDKSK